MLPQRRALRGLLHAHTLARWTKPRRAVRYGGTRFEYVRQLSRIGRPWPGSSRWTQIPSKSSCTSARQIPRRFLLIAPRGRRLVSTPDTCGDGKSVSSAKEVTSTPPGLVKRGTGRRAGASCPRTVPRRTDHQNPPRRRQSLSSARLRHHARPARCCPETPPRSPRPCPVCECPDRSAGRPAADRTGCGSGRQGVFVPGDPQSPAAARDPGRDPPASRTLHHQAQAMARPGHPLRQDRHHLPRRTPPRSHLHLVGQMIRKKRPSSSSAWRSH